MQVPAIAGNRDRPKRSLMQPSAGKSKLLAAGLLQVGSTDGALPRPPRPLLSVREAARLLDLSPATVYKLCADGKLPHARILSAIRIVPADLGEFVLRRRRWSRFEANTWPR
jgi:excisionase family DNA binding protein